MFYAESQKGQILRYMQENPTEKITAILFMGNESESVPFIGYSANTRICDLLRAGLIDVCEEKIEGVKKFHKKARDRNLYQINEKGLAYKFLKNENNKGESVK